MATLLLGVVCIVLLGKPSWVFAFTSLSRDNIVAEAVMGGAIIEEFFGIEHIELTGYSQSNKMIIIQGGAGKELPSGFAPSFNSVLKAKSMEGTSFVCEGGPGPIKVKLSYRFVDFPDQNIEPTTVDCSGRDPLAFAFQINPDEIELNNGKIFQYRIEAEKTVVRSTYVYVRKDFIPKDRVWVDMRPAQQSETFGPLGGRLILPQGNPNVSHASVEIPRGVLKGITEVSMADRPFDQLPAGLLKELNSPAVVYQLSALPSTNGPFKFNLSYPDFEFPIGQVGKLGASEVPEQQGIVYGWDGYKWRKLGGKGDFNANIFTVNAAYYPYLAIAMGNMNPLDMKANRKIITPNGDTINDRAEFPGLSGAVNIFDSNMHKIKTVTGCSSGSSICWDGTDENGETVESGVYIYQFTADGERVSGVIGVAK